ncbi:MAG: hypothetical protein JJ866_17505 [Roseibium sp.]|uniref:hypothetical protein n=1 Tax=Roseibium sp. TaxID=1936156 RepID=UPI001AFF2FAD|nr:hypothetical protein [Roseibium sp.]MBO6893743.1 hypothetical protein [Roseibium sp.]MBO6928564.1 hypothetical protein [Roseibium sp.]
MDRRRSISNRFLTLCFLAGSMVPFGDALTVRAADRPEPTFLESGDNDLIRFQKGDVPGVLGAVEPVPTNRKRLEGASQLLAPEVSRYSAKPEPAAEAEIVADAAVPLETPEELSEQESDERIIEPAISGLTGIAPPAPAPAAAPKRAQRMSSKVAPPAAAPVPAARPLAEEIDARLVTVCLNNPGDASGAKAFDIRRDGPPRYFADIGATSCARFEPTRHTVYFWKSNDLGALSLVLSSKLDLNDADGTQVTMDWLRDR